MGKKMGVFFALLILAGIPLAAKAASGKNSDIKSYGSIIYKDSSGSIELYAEDIALLQEKLASVPDEIFDPVLYSHMHEWEYININSNTHTRHCAGCGSSYDVISVHDAAASKICTLVYNGEEYPGYEKRCRCGYVWKEEMYHNLIYAPKDESYHTLSCVLDGTEYCKGLAAREDMHVIMAVPTDETHHQMICDYCGFAGAAEECAFDYESIEEEGNPDQIQKYCECGNYITEPKETVSGNDTGDRESEEQDEEPGEARTEAPDTVESISDNQTEIIEDGGRI